MATNVVTIVVIIIMTNVICERLNMDYNIFNYMNTNELPDERISSYLRAISSPARLRILLAIGRGEACVCHLEAILEYRH